MSDKELKPCPFCGSSNLTVLGYGIELDGEHPSERPHAVVCESCGSAGKEVAPRSAAIGAWNTRAQLAAIRAAGGEELEGFDRNAAYAACPESGCDWGSFYVGWKAAAAQHQRITAAMAAEVERWERNFRDIHEPALRDAHAYIQELRAELKELRTSRG